jgi:hypothetical protein
MNTRGDALLGLTSAFACGWLDRLDGRLSRHPIYLP